MKKESKRPARVKNAANALKVLQRAVRHHRLYEHTHPAVAESIEEALDFLNRYLGHYGALETEVEAEGLILDDFVVLPTDEEHQATDMIALLFNEGIRSLSFEPGVPRDEILDFAKIMSSNYAETDQDITFGVDLTTALWRRNFSHVQYQVQDQLSPKAVKGAVDVTLRPVAQKIASIVGELTGGEGESKGLDVQAFLAEVEQRRAAGKLDDAANWATIPEKAGLYLESPEGQARKLLLAELDDALMGDLLGRTADIVVWAALDEDVPPAAEDVARFLAGSTMNALALGDVDRAAEMVARAISADGDSQLIAPPVCTRLGTSQNLTLLATALEKQIKAGSDSQSAVSRGMLYLSRLDRTAVTNLCDIYGGIQSDDVRKVFKSFLASRVKEDAEAISKLTFHESQAIVGEAVDVLALAGKDSAAFKILLDASADPSHSIRAQLAKAAVDEITGERERRELLALIDSTRDGEKPKRVAAAKRLGVCGNIAYFEKLGPVIAHASFCDREPDEIEAILATYRTLGKLRSVKVLNELVEKKPFLAFIPRGATRRLATLAELAQKQLDDLKEQTR